MIPKEILNKTDIVVSYAIMHGCSTNPLGHAYLLFSYYCPESKRMIVDDAIGLNPSFVPEERTWRKKISNVSYFDQGHLTQEKYRYLIPNASSGTMNHYHKSWKITAEQYLALTQKINEDRGLDHPLVQRNFQEEHKALLDVKGLPSEEKKCALSSINKIEEAEDAAVGGPYFNVVRNSCKTDALKRLAVVGIDTAGIHNRLIDLPLYSGKISTHKLGFNKEQNQLVWETPLELSPQISFDQESPEMRAVILAQRQYQMLNANIKEMIALFNLKLNDLAHQNDKPVKNVLQKSHDELAQLLNTMISEGADPQHITQENIKAYFKSYRHIIRDTKTILSPVAKSDSSVKEFMQKMLDKFIELCTQFGKLFSTPNTVAYSEHYLLEKAENTLTELKPQLRVRAGV